MRDARHLLGTLRERPNDASPYRRSQGTGCSAGYSPCGGAVGLERVLRGGPSGFMGRPDETRPNPLRPHAAALLLGF